MPLVEHLAELRRRLIISLVAVGVSAIVSLVFTVQIFGVLLRPVHALGMELQAIELTETFTTYIRVALMSGVALALPVIVYQVVRFVAPGLTPREQQILFTFLPFASVLFVIGVVFCYFVLLPPAIKFLLTFGREIAVPQPRLSNYINVVTNLLIWVGLIFETPLIMYLLTRVGVVTPQALSRFRRYAIVGAFVVAALITPTGDIINQTLVGIPLVVLYEIGVLLSRFAARGRQRAAQP